jgi:mannose/cellobiose epimerase-like protein (N-acyl-D-glucosamine 2-epimerase family)
MTAMNRRRFLSTSGLLTLGPLLERGGAAPGRGHTDPGKTGVAIGKIAGYTPAELAGQYRRYLFDDFLPFMEEFVIDHERGGFLCNTDRSGKNLNTNKRAWFDGRGIWVYAFLYNRLKKDPSYLDTAGKTVDLVLRLRPPEGGFWPASYTREGIPLADIPADIYGNLFIAEGLAEYSRACGDTTYWTTAKEILLDSLGVYDRDDYVYSVDYGPEPPMSHAPRVLGHWMVFLRTATDLLSHKADPEVERIAARCIDAIMHYHFNPEFSLINEALNHDLSRPGGPFSRFVYTGHVIETMWMVMDRALRIGNRALFDAACGHFRRHVEVAWDRVYGGVFRGLDDVDRNIWRLDKVLWAQEEVLIGTLCVIEHTADPWALEWFDRMYGYVLVNFPLAKHGHALWDLGGDRKMTYVENAVRVENYHHPRHLMLNILSLERITSAGGKALF